MSEERLSRLIEDFNYRNLNLFFRSKCENYAEAPEDLSLHDDEKFSDFQKRGEIRFDSGDKLVITTSRVSGDISERSGKKAQYEKAKKILKELAVYDAGFFIFHDGTGSFRFSLVYAQFQGTKRSFSNFRRFTYFVSKDQANKTFLNRVGECNYFNLETIKDAFSVEKVNKEFYGHIAEFFYRLTGYKHTQEMQLPSVSDEDKKTHQEFAVRLIGRAIFCWFLKHKRSPNGESLIPESILSSEAVRQNSQYYHSVLEKLFFEVLNAQIKERKGDIFENADKIPFLNGGLFEPHKDDFNEPSLINALKIPDEWFEQFFEILEQYNFTIDENSTVDADVSVDPEMLGRIFENLLAEVNPETGETARKATGSYYTPRTIVDYMVDQSLKQYLIMKTHLEEDRITQLLSYDVEDVSLTDTDKDSVISALDEIKIIDPACGSGAFPMGILHKMLLVLQKVDPDLSIWLRNHLGNIEPGIFRERLLERIKNENWEYVRKLLIIQNSIYGVDIQTIAVEISKLRFFLSLIVDEKIEDAKENRGVEALPNLEFKFVAADSLIGLPPAINRQVGLGITSEEILRLKELRNSYLRSYGREKKKIEEDFRQTRGELIEQTINWGSKDALALQLANWDPFSNKQCEWFDHGWMFGVDGFDIIIANPPYLGEKGHKETFQKIKQGTLREYYQGKMDIFYFFFHLAMNLGNLNCQVAFITTNYYPTAFGATKLRKDFKERAIVRKLVNFNELKIFESALGQHNMITILSEGQDHKAKVDTCITTKVGLVSSGDLQNILNWNDQETSYFTVTQDTLYEGDECYIRLNGSSVEQNQNGPNVILAKINGAGCPLIEICNVDAGLHPGVDRVSEKIFKKYPFRNFTLNEGVFVLSHDEAKKFRGKEYLKPLYKSSDIQRWSVLENSYFILYSSPHKEISDETFITHISRFKEILQDVRSVNNENIKNWKCLRRGVLNELIYRNIPKIVTPYRTNTNRFAYSTDLCYGSQDVYFITEKDKSVSLKYIIALLNSRLYFFWLCYKGKRKGDALELYQKPLSEIQIKKISDKAQHAFITVVDQILNITKDEDYHSNPAKQAKVKEYERQIDQMVYELYGLTPEEIGVVEGEAK